MALTKQVKILKIEICRLNEQYQGIKIFEKLTFDDPNDNTLPLITQVDRVLLPSESHESPVSMDYPDVSGEEQIVQDIAAAIWPLSSP